MSIIWAIAPWPGKWPRRVILVAHLLATAYIAASILSGYLANKSFSGSDTVNGMVNVGFLLAPGALIAVFRLCRDV
ncbi:hypothetical protein [Streptosporangium sp. NPDC049376]|uniref:hypothetical protein n=1 Tax=Streptosporangium sp. NPDC049376 TaxID=3366192 RepID=UPI0037A3263F